jgi:hypothetical protein
VIGFMGQLYFLPRDYVDQHYGPVIVVLELAVFVISLWWMLVHIPNQPKD